MNKVTSLIKINMKGSKVADLHAALKMFNKNIDKKEQDEQVFGASTQQAVLAIQKELGLEQSGEVDEATAATINKRIEEESKKEYKVYGQVQDATGKPAGNVLIKAEDQDLRRREDLGNNYTDAEGQYEIFYSQEDFARAEKDAADLVVSAVGENDVALTQSDVVFNAEKATKIDLKLPEVKEEELTEFENLNNKLSSVLNDIPPETLTKEDIDFLEKEFPNDPIVERQRIEYWSQGASLSSRTGIIVEFFYGIARVKNFERPLTLKANQALSEKEVRAALAQAVKEKIIPSISAEDLEDFIKILEQSSVEVGMLVARTIVGNVQKEDKSGILANQSIKISLLNEEGANELSIISTDSKGNFVFIYNTKPEQVDRLKFELLNEDREVFHSQESEFTGDTEDFVIQVPIDAIPNPPEHSIKEVERETGEAIPQELNAFLEQTGLSSLEAIRKAGGLARFEDLPDKENPVVAKLDAHANLNTISKDVKVNEALINEGYTAINAIAATPRAKFVTTAQPIIGGYQAAKLHWVAQTHMKTSFQIMTAQAVNRVNGHSLGIDPDIIFPIPVEIKCGCEDCESAVSPLAYLADLMEYCLNHLEDDGDAIDLDFLVNNFYQPFAELPADCEAMDEKVRQVRICVEVLRAYLRANPPGASARNRLNAAEAAYRLNLYTSLLSQLGTSFEEIRLARTADQERRNNLAARLGFELGNARPDHLDSLLLEPSTITEEKIEEIFGLAKTINDDNSLPDPLRDIPVPQLLTWKKTYLRSLWQQQDWIEDPFLAGSLPIIDPDIISTENIRNPQAGTSAFDLWQARRTWVDDHLASLQADREANNLNFILEQVFGAPLPDFATWLDNLNNGLEVETTTTELENIHLSSEAFRRFMQIKAKDEDAEQNVEAEEWSDLYAILTYVLKVREYPNWIGEEQTENLKLNGIDFTNAISQPVFNQWLSNAEVQQQWLQVLEQRNSLSIIDPDLLDTGDLANPVTGNPAFDLWRTRRNWINNNLTNLKNTREGAADATAGLTEIIQSVLGVSIVRIDEIHTAENEGNSIEAQLSQLNLNRADFIYLQRIRALLEAGTPILDSEWRNVYSILVQVLKRRNYGSWHEEEQAQGITHSQDFFKLPAAQPLIFPPPPQEELPEYRATISDLRDWRDTLKARIDQDRNIEEALKEAISNTEEIVLPTLRNALITASNVPGTSFDARAKWLTDHLLIDHATDGCQYTTRISQAIETLQTLLFSVRTRQLNDTYPDLDLDADAYDEEWEWIGSYSAWRAAMFAYLYPENILIPSLRRWRTPAFRELVNETQRNRQLNPEQACKAVTKYTDYLRDVASLRVEATCQTRSRLIDEDCRSHKETGYRCLFYIFATGAHTSGAYWSVCDPEGENGYAQSFWTPIPGMDNILNLVGSTVYEIQVGERFIFLFARRLTNGIHELIFTKYDLEQRRWDDEPSGPLELPDEATRITIVVRQTTVETQPPHVAIRTPNGAIYERSLNRDGTDWADIEGEDDDESGGEWIPTIGYLLGRRFSQLCAMVALNSSEYYMIARQPNGGIYYRLFGSRDDAFWRYAGSGRFKGAFKYPEVDYMYVVYGNGSTSYTRPIKRRAENRGTSNRSSVFNFNSWLRSCTGVDFNQWIITDGTRYSGLTLLSFFTLDVRSGRSDNIWEYLQSILEESHYRARVLLYFNYVEEQIESNDAWKEWRIADKIVRQFAGGQSLVSVLRSVFMGQDVGFAIRNTSGEVGVPQSLITGINTIAPTTGNVEGKGAEQRKMFARRNTTNEVGIFSNTFSRNGDVLSLNNSVRIAPRITGPFDIRQSYSEDELQLRKTLIRNVYLTNAAGPASNLEYIKEAYYFIPVFMAMQLQRRLYYTDALDWFRSVYDYSMPLADRKIWHGLEEEEDLTNTYARSDDWLLDPLNPHAIAETRINTYTRFTVISIIQCMLDFADAEFTRDTAESVPRARILYMTALELLESSDLKLHLGLCSDLAGNLNITVGDPKWIPVYRLVVAELASIRNPTLVEATRRRLEEIWVTNASIEDRFGQMRTEIARVKQEGLNARNMGTVVQNKAQLATQVSSAIQTIPAFENATAKTSQLIGNIFGNSVSMITGIPVQTLETENITLPWIRNKVSYSSSEPLQNNRVARRRDYEMVTAKNIAAPSHAAMLGEYAVTKPTAALKTTLKWTMQYVPAPSFDFCIPTNPVIEALQLRAELNLYKIRTCRNISGVERQLDPYAAATDTVTGLPQIGSGGQLTIPGNIVFNPTPYRYSVIIERAKQLVNLAQQVENAFLSALEKRDAEYYNLLKARQDIRSARAGVRLQDLRTKVAEGEINVTELQRDRAQIQADHYKELLDQGLLGYEIANLALLGVAAALQTSAAVLNFIAAALPSSISAGFPGGASVAYSPSGSVSSVASGLSNLAAASGTTASIFSNLASFERREQDWEFQRSLALHDVKIGEQQVKIAQDRLRVVGQERIIAGMQVEHAEQTAEFLANKFTNVELYDWMSEILEGVYAYFLQQAVSTAQLAGNQLAFERQEVPPPFIQEDYWDVSDDTHVGGAPGGNPPNRRGLTGSTRLLQDIYQLDQYAFETEKRKNQIVKNISLAQLAPAEFQSFKQSGILNFATRMNLFDQDFPGEYLRLIKRIRISVIALIPAIDGIKATLTSTGTSKVVVGKDLFQIVNVNRGSETVAYSSPRDAVGLFELATQQSGEQYFPFEGLGVDGQWEFRMPKAANRFNFNSIADVIITMEYTSLTSFTYRQQVIQQLNNSFSAERPFSFRNEFADQWYDLNNPDLTSSPLTVTFRTRPEDFPPNVENLKIQHVVVYIERENGFTDEVTIETLQFRESGTSVSIGGGSTTIDGVVSTRRGNAGSWTPMIGKYPYGEWQLSFPDTPNIRRVFEHELIKNILFVITFKGNTPDWEI